MAGNWTPERRARQAELIRNWRPWDRSTGPKTAEGKERSKNNRYRGAERPKLRELMKELRQALAEQQDALDRI
jgi:hypothetical protein